MKPLVRGGARLEFPKTQLLGPFPKTFPRRDSCAAAEAVIPRAYAPDGRISSVVSHPQPCLATPRERGRPWIRPFGKLRAGARMVLERNSAKLTVGRLRDQATRSRTTASVRPSLAKPALPPRLVAARQQERGRARLRPARPTTALQGPFLPNLSYLAGNSVGERTKLLYEKSLRDFLGFAKTNNLLIGSYGEADLALEAYFNSLFFKGHDVARGRSTLYGYIFFMTQLDGRKCDQFPRTVRCLRGWVKKSYTAGRDAMPFGVACLMAGEWVRAGKPLLGAALLVQFDAYLRPSEVCDLKKMDLLPPAPLASRSYANRWCLLLGNALRYGKTKTGVVDGSVELGGRIRPFVRDIASLLYRRARTPDSSLFETDLSTYEKEFRKLTSQLSLQRLKLVPHSARHGGASHGAFLSARTLTDIKKRGQWVSSASVSRYEKHGKLLRQMSYLSEQQQISCRAAELAGPAAVIRALRS